VKGSIYIYCAPEPNEDGSRRYSIGQSLFVCLFLLCLCVICLCCVLFVLVCVCFVLVVILWCACFVVFVFVCCVFVGCCCVVVCCVFVNVCCFVYLFCCSPPMDASQLLQLASKMLRMLQCSVVHALAFTCSSAPWFADRSLRLASQCPAAPSVK
jgi:ABC-type protease/lipase transport system fused ATPase/permease subunit